MKIKKPILITSIVIIVVSILVIIFDIYLATNKHAGDTISDVLLGWAYKVSIVPYLAGILMGHLFIPRKKTIKMKHITRISILGGVGLSTLILMIASWYHPSIPLIIGIAAGAIFWAQKPDGN